MRSPLIVLRRDWLATLGAGLVVWCLYRYGLLALASADFFLHLNIFIRLQLNSAPGMQPILFSLWPLR